MTAQPLTDALERAHHEIDEGIEAYLASVAAGEPEQAPLLAAFDELRRHIYLEEEHLFPPLRSGGLMAPLMVMVREHGIIWQAMDQVAARLEADPQAAATAAQDLLKILADHNMKEEPVVYPEADRNLGAEDSAALMDLIATDTLPEGWVCQAAR